MPVGAALAAYFPTCLFTRTNMARSVELVLPPDKTDALLAQLRAVPGVVGVRLQRGASLVPAGDVLTLHVSNDAMRPVFRLLAAHEVLARGGTIASGELSTLLLATGQEQVADESSETVWEEIAGTFQAQADLSLNFAVMMLCSGGVAAVGYWSNQAVLLYASQLLAPHFESLLRIPFGLISGSAAGARRGLLATLLGYSLLAVGAALTWLLLRAVDPGTAAGLGSRHALVSLFSVVNASLLVVCLLAAVVGAFIMTTQRSILLSGVYLALPLVPSISLAAIALVNGDAPLVWPALRVWLVAALAVVVAGGLVLGLKQAYKHRRRTLG